MKFKNPKCFEQLSKEDQFEYLKLRDHINKNYIHKSSKNNFKDILLKIRLFTERKIEDRNKRMFVCGIAFLNQDIGIYSSQLSILLAVSKSSINKGFKALGFDTIQANNTHAAELTRLFPEQKNNIKEARNWTIRSVSSLDDGNAHWGGLECKKKNQHIVVPLNYMKIGFVDEDKTSNIELCAKSSLNAYYDLLSTCSFTEQDNSSSNGLVYL